MTRILILCIAVAYATAGIVFHDDLQEVVRLIQREPQWTGLAVVGAAAGLVVLAWSIREGFARSKVVRRTWGWLLAATVAGYVFLMSYPTEAVHYVQFGLLAAALGYTFRRIAPAMVATVVVGMLDEAYQYWWLHRHWGVYYDFNDVLLNIIAAGLGLAVVAELRPGMFFEERHHATTQRQQRTQGEGGKIEGAISSSFFASLASLPSLRDHSFIFALSVAALFAVGVWTGLIALQTADVQDHTLLLLNRMVPFETFWDTWGGTAKAHHIVRAWPGVILTALMTIVGVRLVEGMRRTERGERR